MTEECMLIIQLFDYRVLWLNCYFRISSKSIASYFRTDAIPIDKTWKSSYLTSSQIPNLSNWETAKCIWGRRATCNCSFSSNWSCQSRCRWFSAGGDRYYQQCWTRDNKRQLLRFKGLSTSTNILWKNERRKRWISYVWILTESLAISRGLWGPARSRRQKTKNRSSGAQLAVRMNGSQLNTRRQKINARVQTTARHKRHQKEHCICQTGAQSHGFLEVQKH